MLDQERKEEREERKKLDTFINEDDNDSLDGFIVFSGDDDSDVEIIPRPPSSSSSKGTGRGGSSSRGSSVARENIPDPANNGKWREREGERGNNEVHVHKGEREIRKRRKNGRKTNI